MKNSAINSSILVCSASKSSSAGLCALLQARGFLVKSTQSYSQALLIIEQEMPHLIVFDSLLIDGNVGFIFDFIRKHAHLSKTPIVVKVEKKSKEHIEPLVGKKFASIILGDVKPELFIEKISSILANYALNSPFFFPAEEIFISSQMSLAIDVSVLGRSDDLLVIRSSMSVDSRNKLICQPTKKQLEPAILTKGENVKVGDDLYNLFPMHKIIGKGLIWMRELPNVDINPQFAASFVSNPSASLCPRAFN